jgi:hypothetical protein
MLNATSAPAAMRCVVLRSGVDASRPLVVNVTAIMKHRTDLPAMGDLLLSGSTS